MGSWLPLVAVCLGSFMLMVDVTVVNVALPSMGADLDASFADLQSVIDVYAISLAALLLGAGAVADRYGHRAVYLSGLIVFALASAYCGVAPSNEALTVARAMQGTGAAAMFATTISLINASYEGRQRGIAFGVWGAVNGAAAATGPIVGGFLTQTLSWRWIFFVNLPICALAILLTLAVLAPGRVVRPGVHIDLFGIVAFTITAGALTKALSLGPTIGWTAPTTLALFGLAALAAIAFVAKQLRGRNPVLDLRLLRRPAFAATMIASLLLSIAAFPIAPLLSLWLQTVCGMSPIGAGLALVPLAVAALVTALVFGRVSHRFEPRMPLVIGLALVGAGELLRAHLGAGSDWLALAPGLAVTGVGVGLASPTVAAAALAAVPKERSGMAAGAVNTMRQLGYALGIAILGGVTQAGIGAKLAGEGVAAPGAVAERLIGGQAEALLSVAGRSRATLDAGIHASFASGLNVALIVAGVAGLAGAMLTGVLLRPPRPAPKPRIPVAIDGVGPDVAPWAGEPAGLR